MAYTWGDGLCGKLGHGDTAACLLPRRLEGLLDGWHVASVACGTWHTAAVARARGSGGGGGGGVPLQRLSGGLKMNGDAGDSPGARHVVAITHSVLRVLPLLRKRV